MEFCSEFGYNYGFDGSDNESISDEEEETKKRVIKQVRKADSNIIAVKFDQLVMLNEMFAGEPKKCKNCEAIMSVFSKENIDEKKIWTCEFCYEKNDLNGILTTLDEIPKQADATFLIEPAPVAQHDQAGASTASAGVKSTDNNYLSFCIDISGSMDTFIPVKEESSDGMKNDNTKPISVDQVQVSKNMTRLQGVKIACVENLNVLKDEEPNKRVNLITFSGTVKYYGDGSKVKGVNGKLLEIGGYGGYRFQPQPPNSGSIWENSCSYSDSEPEETVQENSQNIAPENAPDILENREKLMTLAQNQDGNLKGINETKHNLEMLIKNLKSESGTALGPGLVFAVGFAAKKPGSQIILCTDGAANIGMGSMGHGDESEKFYEDLADEAKSKGVTVNVISMEGTDCKLAILGKISDRTNGTMNIVNPLNLSNQFKSILDNRIVATNVQAKLIVNNKYLYIRDETLETEEGKAILTNNTEAKERIEKMKKSIVVNDIGNANIDTEITFEYGIRKLKEKAELKDLSELPFQLQITYTTYDGAKALRVYTKKQKFTTDRDKAEKALLSQNLIYSNAAQKMSYQVMSNNIGVAKYRDKQIKNLEHRQNWTSPAAYACQSNVVQAISKSTRAEDLSDKMAEEMYKGKKLNRNKL